MAEQLSLGFRLRDARIQSMFNELNAQYSVQVFKLSRLIKTERDTDTTDYVEQLAEAKRQLGYLREAERQQAEGSYGICHSCGEEIKEDELKALPFRVDCKACEDKAVHAHPEATSVSRFQLLRSLAQS